MNKLKVIGSFELRVIQFLSLIVRKKTATLPAIVAASAAVSELAPELGGLDRLGEDERVEDDDGGVRDQLDQDELGPEHVVLLVVLVLPQVRAPRGERKCTGF